MATPPQHIEMPSHHDGVVLMRPDVLPLDVSPLKETERRLAEAVRLRDEFLARLSHELRNSLGAIQSAINLMSLNPDLDDEVCEARDVIERQSVQLARLLDDLLGLPRLDQAAAPAERDLRAQQRPETFDCRVVIVEDGDDSRVILRRLLESQGCTVFAAENGLEGLAAIEQHRPDVAIVDIGLPGLSGYDVARRVRSNPANADTYLVALTGYGGAADAQQALDAGFDSHLVKPLDVGRLTRILESQSRRTEGAE